MAAPTHREGDVESMLQPVRRLLAGLMRSEASSAGDIEGALRQVTEVAAHVLGVSRVGVWRFAANQTAITCVDLFDRSTNTHSQGAVVEAHAAPTYFRSLSLARSIVADDAVADPRTHELADPYLRLHGITSLLDSPIFVRGEMQGVICLEHQGPARAWAFWEELLAGSLADFVALAWGAAAQLRQAHELAQYRHRLEALVELKTKALLGAEENLRNVLSASPVALMVIRIADQAIVFANQQALTLFEVPLEKLDHHRSTDFWAQPGERDKALAELLQHNRLEGFGAAFKTFTGRTFWGEISARLSSHKGEPCLVAGVRDVSDQQAARLALEQNRNALDLVFQAAPTPLILIRERDRMVLRCNAKAEILFGKPASSLLGQPAPALMTDEEARNQMRVLYEKTGSIEGLAVQLMAVDKMPRWGLVNARRLTTDGEPCIFMSVTDVSEQKRLEGDLRELATTDALTGALNRRRFDELLQAEMRGETAFTLAEIDVDHFKRINDTHGHLAGDEALQWLCATIQKHIRHVDILARYGGEEFMLLMPRTALPEAMLALERVRLGVEKHFFEFNTQTVAITVSIGASSWKKGESRDALFERVDHALYSAKANGRNQVLST
jgi:diguanylate cyclase (GGDEF)-like protein/PAS domain S-box-containing protein